MAKRSKKLIKNQRIASFLTLTVGVTFAYFMWLTWRKVTEMIGDSNLVWMITGGVVILGIALGLFSTNKIIRRFTS